MAEAGDGLRIEVVLVAPGLAWRSHLQLPAGSTVAEAIDASGVRQAVPPGRGFDLEHPGVYGRAVALDEPLHDGDRIEFYRPLEADPKDARRRRAAHR